MLFIGSLTSLLVAMARPVVPENVLSRGTTIILALDTSGSMCMQDMAPNRLEVARTTALSFVQHLVVGTRVGIVVFSGFATVAQEPTTNLSLLENAITNLNIGAETDIGSAILRSLDAISEVDKRVASSKEVGASSKAPPKQSVSPKYLNQGHVPPIIVLLTDGASNTGPSPLLAAQLAAERGVRIYSIGFGTSHAAPLYCGSPSRTNLPIPPGSGSPSVVSSVNMPDYATLKQIAEITGGEFYPATNAAELQTVFQKLHTYIAQTNQTIEVSAYFAAIGAVLAMAAFIAAFFLRLL